VFLDIVTINLESGKGGDGCVSTRTEKFVPRGGPDGGNGGAGGNVWLEATSEMSTLLDFRYRRNYKAGVGKAGGGNRRTGADGEGVTLRVPRGTIVVDEETGEQLADLTVDGQKILVARGGRGGKGNWEFRNPRNQTPMRAQPGRPGQTINVRLELKLIADIGLVGEPNAGKSTLLSVLTSARPKIADYPFTTLVPNLGIVDLGDFTSCTLADIPGLIEGASEGKGLGHEFLRHVERTRALLLMVDPSLQRPGPTLDVLRGELEQHGGRLGELPYAVAVTKQDLMDGDAGVQALAEVEAWADEHGARAVVPISSVTQTGLTELRHVLRDLYRTGPQAPDDD
jgi:GTP-binding protein